MADTGEKANNRRTLYDAVIRNSHRTDMEPYLDLFQELSNNKINTHLRSVHNQKTTTISYDAVNKHFLLPDDYIAVGYIFYKGQSVEVGTMRDVRYNITRIPIAAIFNNAIIITPDPVQGDEVELGYYHRVEFMSDDASFNGVLLYAYNTYYYAMMGFLSMFLEQVDEAAYYNDRFLKEVDDLKFIMDHSHPLSNPLNVRSV